MSDLLGLAIRLWWRRGILEGKRTWVALGMVALAARIMSRLVGRDEVVVFSEPLEMGEVLLISNLREEWSGKRAD
jgi:hypothetical protein